MSDTDIRDKLGKVWAILDSHFDTALLGDEDVDMIDNAIHSYAEAWADEVIGEDEPDNPIPKNDYYWRIRNELRAKQRNLLKGDK